MTIQKEPFSAEVLIEGRSILLLFAPTRSYFQLEKSVAFVNKKKVNRAPVQVGAHGVFFEFPEEKDYFGSIVFEIPYLGEQLQLVNVIPIHDGVEANSFHIARDLTNDYDKQSYERRLAMAEAEQRYRVPDAGQTFFHLLHYEFGSKEMMQLAGVPDDVIGKLEKELPELHRQLHCRVIERINCNYTETRCTAAFSEIKKRFEYIAERTFTLQAPDKLGKAMLDFAAGWHRRLIRVTLKDGCEPFAVAEPDSYQIFFFAELAFVIGEEAGASDPHQKFWSSLVPYLVKMQAIYTARFDKKPTSLEEYQSAATWLPRKTRFDLENAINRRRHPRGRALIWKDHAHRNLLDALGKTCSCT
ncbi:MAG: hypothetical protein AB7N71_05140 [Phycisphaerae bacterium]